MKVTIVAFGTRGDVQPLIALGVGLRDVGHAVRFVTQVKFCDLASRCGLECAPVEADVRLPSQKKVVTGYQSPLTLYRLAQHYLKRTLADVWDGCKDAEALIFSDWGRIPSEHIVEKLDIPAFMSFIHPQQMKFLYPETLVYGPRYRWVTSLLRKQMLWHIGLKRQVNIWRKHTLGLPPTTFSASEGLLKTRKVPFFYAYSPTVYPKPANWPDWFHVTGYCFLDRPADWSPPAALLDFLASGPPPVYVGFSSMTNRKIERMMGTLVEGLSLAKQRGILVTGWSELAKSVTLPESVFAIDAVPHDWLFPQLAAAVHHGGSGTTAAAFRAGIPSVVVPFALDQPFWGWRVSELGAGPPALPPKQLTAERLAQAINTAVTDTTIRHRATALGEQIRAEDGVAQAVALFHHYLGMGTQ